MTVMRYGRRLAAGWIVALIGVASWVTPAAAVDVQRVVSDGGIEAWLVEDHTNPIIAVRFAFRGGGALDPVGKTGLARMTAALVDEGAGELDSQAFQGRLEDLAVRLRFDAGLDTFGGSLQTLTENRDAAFEMLRLALTEPRFDAEPVERIRRQLLAGLRREAEDPNAIASRAFFAQLFPDHPYARPVNGDEATVASITVDDLRAFVARRLARDTLMIGVVGDITPQDLSRLLDTTFGDLPVSATASAVPDVTPVTAGGTRVIDLGVPQSAFIFGHGGLKRADPDYYAATVVEYILGRGSFTSRLYQEVREKRGLAYSVYSSLVPLDHAGLVIGRAGTANARAGETAQVIRDVWQRMREDGVTAKELADAKTFLTGSFPLRFSSSGRIASILVAMQLEDLGIDYLDRRNGLIEAVTLEDANRVVGRILDPEALTMIVVGRPEGLPPTN